MKKSITLFPTIDDRMIETMGCNVRLPEAYYEVDSRKYELEIEPLEGSPYEYTVTDDRGYWNIKEHNLVLSGNIKIDNPRVLFGENGVTGIRSTLGVGIMWKSKATDLRGARKLLPFRYDESCIEIPINKTFSASKIKEGVEVSIVVYIEDAAGNEGTPFAKETGTVLGEIGSYDFILEGNGSQFTVIEKKSPGEPLWRVECDWEDCSYNQFSETVRIVLNTAHPAWGLFENPDFKREMLKEIMATGMQAVISKTMDEGGDIESDYERGSVLEAVSYFTGRASVDLSSPQETAVTIRKYLDKVVK